LLAGEFHQWKEGELAALVHKSGWLSLMCEVRSASSLLVICVIYTVFGFIVEQYTVTIFVAFSALMLLVGRQEGYPVEVHRQCFGRLSAPNNWPITDCFFQDACSFNKSYEGGYGTIFEIE